MQVISSEGSKDSLGLVNILKDNKDLRARLTNVESIITNVDNDTGQLREQGKTTLTEEEARELMEGNLQ